MSTAYEKNCNESRKTGTLGSYIYNLKDNVEIKMPVTNKNKILLEKNAKVFAFDPIFKTKSDKNKLPNECNVCSNIEDVLKNSDIALVFTKWNDFKCLDSKFLKKYMKNPVLIDGRGFLDEGNFEQGCYYKIGYTE